MDPQFNKEPALRLPQPMPNHAVWPAPVSGSREQAPNLELGSQPSQSAPMLTTPTPLAQTQNQQLQPVAVPPAPNPSQMSSSAASTATDLTDERVWVERAKRIVEQTHADPYLESQEIGKFKAEYLKDVHAKNIKVAEG